VRSVSSIADLIKKQYERSADDKGRERKEGKGRRSNLETENMKRVSLWLDKETYSMIQNLIDALRKEPLASAFATESELIRNLIRKGFPALISDFQKMFPNLSFPREEV